MRKNGKTGCHIKRGQNQHNSMRKRALPNGLRRERRSWGLSQVELARLCGRRSNGCISRIEHDGRKPGLNLLIALSILFDMPLERMFQALYDQIEERTLRQACMLHKRLEKDKSAIAARKREFLEGILARAVARQRKQKHGKGPLS